MYIQYLHHIHLLTPFLHLLHNPTGINLPLPPQDLFALLFSDFLKEKLTFLFKIAKQGVSL
jgi:hypothetical protein